VKRELFLFPAVHDLLRQTAPSLRAMIVDILSDLTEESEPPTAQPYGGIPGALEVRTDTFRLLCTRWGNGVSVWVLQIDT
jgi:hypothetical protein